jgi:CHAT domain-containing protein/tetratricopeptide (TPR) repeat protein
VVARSRCLLVLLGLLFAGSVFAAAPPVPLSKEQARQCKEQEQLLDQALKAVRAKLPAKALPLVVKALQIERTVFGEVRPSRMSALQWLAEQHVQRGEYPQAIRAREELLHLCRQLYPPADWRVVDARWALSDVKLLARLTAGQRERLKQADERSQRAIQEYQKGRPAAGVKFAEEARKLFEEVLGKKHPTCAMSVYNLAVLHRTAGEPERAEALFLEALSVRKELLGELHPDFIRTLNDLATLYQDMGVYRKAVPLLVMAEHSYREAAGEKHPEHINSLINLAQAYRGLGKYDRALPLFQKALALRKEVLGEKHPEYANSLNTLAVLYRDMGDFSRALPLLKEAMRVRKEANGEKHADNVISLNNLAYFSMDLGDRATALSLFQQALTLIGELLGEKHPDYATCLNNLALLYQDMGRPARALPLLRRTLALRQETLGEKHPAYAGSLHNLGALYHDIGDYSNALPLYQQAMEVFREKFGNNHPAYAHSLSRLAALYQDMKQYSRALSLYEKALAIQRTQGVLHHDHITGLDNLASLYEEMDRPGNALLLAWQSLSLTRRYMDETSLALSERQQIRLARQWRSRLDVFLRLARDWPETVDAAYAEVLAWKGAASIRQRLCRLALPEASRPALDELRDVTREVAALIHADSTEPDRLGRLDRLSRRAAEVDVELSRSCAEYRLLRAGAHMQPAELRQSLPTGTALVDYCVCSGLDPTEKDPLKRKQRHLLAFIIRPGAPIVRLELGRVPEIAEQVFRWRQSPDDKVAGSDLRKHVWEPLQAHLKDVKTVLVSPAGPLGYLSFAGLPGSKEGTYLIEEVAVAVVPVPALLPGLLKRREPADGGIPSLLLVGDVNFAKRSAGDRTLGRDSLRTPGEWKLLPATQMEMETIQREFIARYRTGKTLQLSGRSAGKEAVQRAMAQHGYLHLATHGFFAEESMRSPLERQERRRGDDLYGERGVTGRHPSMLAGIVLSGANGMSREGENNGILTALEVTQMDLSGVNLVVLSACDTATEKRKSGEGVLGLQRAFQTAGARTLVSSMWRGHDAATSLLMEEFYRRLWGEEKLSKLEALRQAQLHVLRNPAAVEKRAKALRATVRGDAAALKLPENDRVGGRSHPLWWAAFVLSGDWR